MTELEVLMICNFGRRRVMAYKISNVKVWSAEYLRKCDASLEL